jgi:hypothetical protein
MKDHWKDRVRPNLNHILSLFDRPELGAFITGHLILESVLVQLIELKLTDKDRINLFDMSFPSKVNMAKSRGLIDNEMSEFLIAVNTIRNHLAHRLGEEMNFKMMYSLVQIAHRGGVDFSDDTIHSDKSSSEEWYGAEGIIQEIFQNAALALAFIMEQHGGEFQFD